DVSSLPRTVAAVGVPPDAATFMSGPPAVERLKTITPVGHHAADPLAPAVSHTVAGGPPVTSIFLSFPSAKNPTKRLSGDQNGRWAPSVPASGCAATASSERTTSSDLPSRARASNTSRRPSGDTANGAKVVLDWSIHPSGGEMTNRITRRSGSARVKYIAPTSITVAAVMTLIAASETQAHRRGRCGTTAEERVDSSNAASSIANSATLTSATRR